ncbi:predicted protein [Chaetomium globosum CBS 148.51]|uniref:Uncharacterized protein n=1 Tax=Chaetomium globosum (strain ATCC 6205 / CBS 148.51 / DSM 1962 / NBRC 6347 / NRRL 1970) TaxID=306901 RepID=Q2GPA5_CHAGB|nr:uncharacterized protein CHGG_10199 [Chaetomium globosum CBS 148.51]EAQ83795.1 predicted protein [Chaetomium globosum CBS 148.51]
MKLINLRELEFEASQRIPGPVHRRVSEATEVGRRALRLHVLGSAPTGIAFSPRFLSRMLRASCWALRPPSLAAVGRAPTMGEPPGLGERCLGGAKFPG